MNTMENASQITSKT